MSEQIIKIIPENPAAAIPNAVLLHVREYLLKNIICESVEIKTSAFPEFVDCGSNLGLITCPKCGKSLEFDWWGEATNTAAESSFQKLDTVLPCCGKTVSLHDLNYDFPCGFSKYVIELWNPKDSHLDQQVIDQIQGILAMDIRVIYAHI